jgi:hypothetical protein
MNRRVDGPQKAREVDGTLIVPVVEEVLEIQKVWILKEEIHIGLREKHEIHRESVTLEREEARVEKLDETGRVVTEAEPVEPPPASPFEPPAESDTPATRNIRALDTRSGTERSKISQAIDYGQSQAQTVATYRRGAEVRAFDRNETAGSSPRVEVYQPPWLSGARSNLTGTC